MRRLGRLFGHHRQPGAGRGGRPAGARTAAPRSCPRRRRSTAPSTCSRAARSAARSARSWSSASAGGRTTRARNGGEMNNNPSPGNKAGGLTTILEKSLGAVAKGGTTQPGRASTSTPSRSPRKRLRLHGHARLRPGLGHRPGRRRRQRDLLHHRPRLGLRLQAGAVAQARHQHRRCTRRMEEDMDINCGDIVDGEAIDRADGRADLRADPARPPRASRPRARPSAIGDDEFVPWQIGAVM